jgi:uncharacterized protein YfaS (alpha-2-macroglobulin family)
MILGTLPRVLGPLETIKLPVTVFAMENNMRNVTVTLQSNAFLETVGGASQQVSFTSPGEQMLYFDVKVKDLSPNSHKKIIVLCDYCGEELFWPVIAAEGDDLMTFRGF